MKMLGSEQTDLFCYSSPHPDGMRHHFSPVTAFGLIPCLGKGRPAASPGSGQGLAGWGCGLSDPSSLLALRQSTSKEEQGCRTSSSRVRTQHHEFHPPTPCLVPGTATTSTLFLEHQSPASTSACPPHPLQRWGDGLLSLVGIHGRGRQERSGSGTGTGSSTGTGSRLKPGSILVAARPLPPRLMSCFSNFEAESHGSF